MMVPIVGTVAFWSFLAAVIILPMYFRHRDRIALHQTLQSAFEKGVALPPDLITSLQSNLVAKSVPTREGDLRRGIVLLGLGIGIALLGYGLWYGLASVDDTAANITGACTAGAGAIPGLIGVAYLILWATKSKTPAESTPPRPQGTITGA